MKKGYHGKSKAMPKKSPTKRSKPKAGKTRKMKGY